MSRRRLICNVPSRCENFEALVNKYRRQLFLYALQILHNHEDAEEAVQDAFLKAYRSWSTNNVRPPDDGRLRAWFFKIMLNVARNRLRRKPPSKISVHEMNDFHCSNTALENRVSPDVIVDRHTTIDLAERAICALPAHLFEAARLRFIEGLPHSEIARRCSRPEGTVKSQVFRAKRLLRQLLDPVFVF